MPQVGELVQQGDPLPELLCHETIIGFADERLGRNVSWPTDPGGSTTHRAVGIEADMDPGGKQQIGLVEPVECPLGHRLLLLIQIAADLDVVGIDQIERHGSAIVDERGSRGRNCRCRIGNGATAGADQRYPDEEGPIEPPHTSSRSTNSTGWQGHVGELGVVSDTTPNWRVASAAMRISERVDNAVRAMGELAVGGTEPVKAETIANRQDISLKYLLDIMRDLKRAELVRSKRGPDGGFALSRPAAEISLADVFRAVDGPLADVHDESLRGLEYPAPLQALPQVWMAIRGSLRRVLETVSVADLVSGDLPDGVVETAAEYRAATEARFGK